jgi:hypothetical protein
VQLFAGALHRFDDLLFAWLGATSLACCFSGQVGQVPSGLLPAEPLQNVEITEAHQSHGGLPLFLYDDRFARVVNAVCDVREMRAGFSG